MMSLRDQLAILLGTIKGVGQQELDQFTQEASEIIAQFLEAHATSPNYALLAEHGVVQISQKAAQHFLRAERVAVDTVRTATLGLLLELAAAQ